MPVDAAEHPPLGQPRRRDPGLQRLDRAGGGAGALDRQNLACALLVGIAAPNSDATRRPSGTTATSSRVSAASSERRSAAENPTSNTARSRQPMRRSPGA